MRLIPREPSRRNRAATPAANVVRLVHIATFALLMAGCVSPTFHSASLPYDRELEAYVECNARNSVAYASQPGDAMSLAVAAETDCGAVKLILLRAIAASVGTNEALKIVSDAEEGMVHLNERRIAHARAQ